MFSMQTFFTNGYSVCFCASVNVEILQFAMQVHQVEALVAYKFNEEAWVVLQTVAEQMDFETSSLMQQQSKQVWHF